MNRPLMQILLDQPEFSITAEQAADLRRKLHLVPAPTDWRGLKAADRAQPLTDLGRRLLGLHVATATPKEN